MHFLIQWVPRTENIEKNAKLTINILSAFSGFKFAKVFETTYVVSVENRDQYKKIYDKVIAFIKADPAFAYIIVTQPMAEASYRGWLPKSIWPELNRVSKGVDDESE